MTLPFQVLVASSDSRCGISMIWVGVWSLLPPPIWNSENEHGWQVVHCASAAAIFIGWYLASITPSSSKIWVGVWSLLPPPIWNSENEHGWQVVHCASAAAIFIGWYLASITPSSSPTSMVNKIAGTRTTTESRAVLRNTSLSRPCRSCHADTASITPAPVTSEASKTLEYPQTNTGLVNSAQMSFSCGFPLTIL